MRRTLVALNDSLQGLRAFEYALSTYNDDAFVLVHVIDYSESITDPNRGGRGRLEGWYQKATEDAEELLSEGTGALDEHGVS
ncbi:hypothetical protein NDI76_16335 [Halogeometricum sp. S1BR25-6]|uniref:UspA domain-containing protein n=1 Tax=Halogeometricum salsisoli TaxID=2950536 RepID=A0ABU2GHL2_9EURY|nr:hypothetical protein [Halogeometricum sp. S1BR25-6]MDS0300315.1 hypothetical protein [Halogeometricum sp. S1BR25-6]